jgi:predicted nucleic acid-binding protein
MTVIDTSLLADMMGDGQEINENVCMISIIEYPLLLEYPRFKGKVLLAELRDFELALEIQRKLMAKGRMKPAADLIIAATCINRGETLRTADSDFEEIRKVSDLKVVLQ